MYVANPKLLSNNPINLRMYFLLDCIIYIYNYTYIIT